MKYKIAVIGGGWYGCHLGLMLDATGCDVTIFEKNKDLLMGASGNNQFRLHMGFHYARHHRTRVQSRDGFLKFVDRYPELSKPIKNNYYIVPKYDSVIDYETYRIVMFASGVNYQEIKESEFPNYFCNIEGMMNVDERVILTKKAREHFKKKLKGKIRLGVKVSNLEVHDDFAILNNEKFDFVIDATWGHLQNLDLNCFFEPTVLLYYKYKGEGEFPAFTMVDGPLCSLYPTEEPGIYTLSSVKHTPIGRFKTIEEAKNRLANYSNQELQDKIKDIEDHMISYFSDFKSYFEYHSPQLSIKTKLVGEHDDRSCYVKTTGRLISVFSGKIDTIFFASQKIIDYLERFVHGEFRR